MTNKLLRNVQDIFQALSLTIAYSLFGSQLLLIMYEVPAMIKSLLPRAITELALTSRYATRSTVFIQKIKYFFIKISTAFINSSI